VTVGRSTGWSRCGHGNERSDGHMKCYIMEWELTLQDLALPHLIFSSSVPQTVVEVLVPSSPKVTPEAP
ncbi:MAG TPA: hypothetical protein PLI69_07870, partial [Bacteroidales bacterium]|nr:hypothetical protein [Bacteroidales bacterium]